MGTEREIWERMADKFREIQGGKEIPLPPMCTVDIMVDFKKFVIGLSRYKFAGKMLEGKKRIMDVGCNTGFKTMSLAQYVERVTGIDFDENAIVFANKNYANDRLSYLCANIMEMKPLKEKMDGVVSLDVIEHIEKANERIFLQSIVDNMNDHGVCIIGTPNITASQYQSETSKVGHINMYSHDRLRGLMEQYFHNVFMFAMNDEVVHTGFLPMAHYLIAVGVGVRNRNEKE